MIYPDRIAARMDELGLSQGELARRVGVSQPTIFKVLRGNKAGSRHLHQIARELRTTVAYIIGETDDPTAELPDESFSSQERDWIDLLRVVETEDRKAIIRLTRTAAQRSASTTIHDSKLEFKGAAEPTRLSSARVKRRGRATETGDRNTGG